MEFQFLISKTQDRTFLQTFKVRIQVLWCKKNTASHKKSAHTWLENDGPYMTVFTGSMSPWCCRRKECIKAITPVFWSFIQPKLARYRSCFVQVDPNLFPTHFSAASVNASVNGDRESAVLIAHWFIVTIKSMNPVWASLPLVFLLLKLRSLFQRVHLDLHSILLHTQVRR